MTAIFLAADCHTLVTKHIDHVHITETDDEEEQATFYAATYFFLDGGMLILATSSFARERWGVFIGVIADGEDPESLRELADREAVMSFDTRARMQ